MAKKLLGRVDNKFNNIPQCFKNYSPNCIDLLNSLLTWDPKKRISVSYRLILIFLFNIFNKLTYLTYTFTYIYL